MIPTGRKHIKNLEDKIKITLNFRDIIYNFVFSFYFLKSSTPTQLNLWIAHFHFFFWQFLILKLCFTVPDPFIFSFYLPIKTIKEARFKVLNPSTSHYQFPLTKSFKLWAESNILWSIFITPKQWRSQEFRLGGARLKDKIGNKKLI